jgi:hypothetical protein
MRVMEIPPFPRKIDIADLDNFLRTRLNAATSISGRSLSRLGFPTARATAATSAGEGVTGVSLF